jgi:chromosome segregation ATPase
MQLWYLYNCNMDNNIQLGNMDNSNSIVTHAAQLHQLAAENAHMYYSITVLENTIERAEKAAREARADIAAHRRNIEKNNITINNIYAQLGTVLPISQAGPSPRSPAQTSRQGMLM